MSPRVGKALDHGCKDASVPSRSPAVPNRITSPVPSLLLSDKAERTVVERSSNRTFCEHRAKDFIFGFLVCWIGNNNPTPF